MTLEQLLERLTLAWLSGDLAEVARLEPIVRYRMKVEPDGAARIVRNLQRD